MIKSSSIKLGVQQKMKKIKKRRKPKIKSGIRAMLCQHLARVMAYHDHGHMDLAQWHARLLVGELIKYKLIDPTLPLRPMEAAPPVTGGD